MFIVSKLFSNFKRKRFNKIWHFYNKNNMTTPGNMFDLRKVTIGCNTYGTITVNDWSPDPAKLVIGSYCSIAPGVQFLLGSEHNLNTISTYPFKVKKFGYNQEARSKGSIIIKDDVWIGMNAIICSGITIGQGSVIAAGAVVTKDIDPYAIVGGNPAHIIKYRFSKDIIERLLKLNISNILNSFTEKDIPIIYSTLNNDILNKLEKINNE
jgi:acetyltransferase-like isoleucine patch superfamily enzyme